MKKNLFFIVSLGMMITGCLSDTITGYQVIPQLILQPPAVYYRCITSTTNLEVRWNPSFPVDTQSNFKGYFVQLYNSTPYKEAGGTSLVDSTYGPAIDSAYVPKIDTMYTFIGKVIQGNRYTVRVWGQRFSNPAKPDSVVLSQFSTGLSFYFDSRPVLAPDSIFASSASSSNVYLFWTPSKSEMNIGMAGYIIRYIDPDNSSAHVIYYNRFAKDTSSLQYIKGRYETLPSALNGVITVPVNVTTPIEKEYVFWIKAIRQDSTESDDSIGIKWSGAEQLNTQAAIDTGIVLGAGNGMYAMQQTDPNGTLASFQITQSGGNFIIIGKNNTVFVNQVVQDTGLTLNRNFFRTPFVPTDFTQTQISFPIPSSLNVGTIIYASFPTNSYVSSARILFTQIQDSISHKTTNFIQASVQPKEPSQLSFF